MDQIHESFRQLLKGFQNIGTRWKGRITHYDEPTFLALFQFVFSFLRYVGCIQFWFVVNTNKSKINKKAQVVSVLLTIYCIYRNLIYNSKHFSKQFGNEKIAFKIDVFLSIKNEFLPAKLPKFEIFSFFKSKISIL